MTTQKLPQSRPERKHDGVRHDHPDRISRTPIKPKPACAARPDDWDLDIGTPDVWQEAVQTCHRCPILAQCRELAETLIARGMPPRSLIWAGVGYDRNGNVIENLDHHRVRPTERKRPLRIMRTAPVYVRSPRRRQPTGDPESTPPRRMIMLRRRRLPPPNSGSG